MGCAAPRAYGDSSEDSILLGEREELAEDCFQDGVDATADRCNLSSVMIIYIFKMITFVAFVQSIGL